jgi:TRAP-type C4-dicarboxylate transport system permease small subunit
MGYYGTLIMLKLWDLFTAAVQRLNVLLGHVAALMIVTSTVAISFEVVARYVFRHPHDWNLELNIFLLVGSTFLAAAHTQMKRGHVGIEVLDKIMPAHWSRWRYFLSDVLSLLFSALITFYVWKYFHEAWEGDWVTDSTWGPKEWIPYALMGVGMTALCLQLLVQIGDDLLRPKAIIEHEASGE